MQYLFSENPDLEAFKKLLKEMEDNSEVTSIGIFTTFNNKSDTNELQSIVSKCSKPVFGAFYPGLIYDSNLYQTGYLLIGITSLMKIHGHILTDISKKTLPELEKEVSELNLDILSTKTVLLIVDAFSDGIKNVVDAFFNIHSLDYNYIGGGAGDIDFVSKPCVFTNEGIWMDAALVLSLDTQIAIGVNHGLKPIEGPFVITKSDKNIVYEIEYMPALEFYQDMLRKHYPEEITKDNFHIFAQEFPLGLPKLDSEAIVRGPLQFTDDGAIQFVGPVPENSTAFIMSGNIKGQMEGSIAASLDADKENVAPFCFIFDCISRASFIGEEYSKALSLVRLRDEMVFGALVVGEIANQQKSYLEYYNKTCVIARMLF